MTVPPTDSTDGPDPAADPDDGWSDDDWSDASWNEPESHAPEDPMGKGVEALRVAAQEVLAAARAMIDVADELVRDPHAADAVLGVISSAARAATKMAGSVRPTGDDDDDNDDGDPGVQRIPVS